MSHFFEQLILMLSNRKLLVIIGGLCALFASLSFFSVAFLDFFSQVFGVYLTASTIPIALLTGAIISFSLLYLQSGGSQQSKSYLSIEELQQNIDHHAMLAKLEIDKLRKQIGDVDAAVGLDESEKSKAIQDIVGRVTPELIEVIFASETEKFKKKLKVDINLDRLTASSRRSVDRLSREISDLRLRSNINLVIGMAITAGGLYLLWNTISMVDASVLLKQLASEGQESNVKFLKNLILPIVPRVLLVIFVEVFAYFFLRLYRNGLSEIKYFQNELTNIESKLTAVEFSYVTKNDDALKFAVEALSKTERNFVLEKGQTTVELEKAKSESELTKNIIRTVPRLFERSAK